MTTIDCTDCYLAIEIGDGVKRALVRHFSGFITDQLEARGFAAQTDAALEKIDRDAWRLAARVLYEVKKAIDSALDETLLAPDPEKTVQAILVAAVETEVKAVELHYLGDTPFGFASFIARFGEDDIAAAPRRTPRA